METAATPETAALAKTPAKGKGKGKGGETAAHLRLKHAAYVWALHTGYRCAALEVSLANSSYRADVAAYRPVRRRVEELDTTGLNRRLIVRDVLGATALFECKQSRADFLKDSREARRILAELEKLSERRRTLELQLKVHYPRLQRGDSLFPEYQTADLEHLEHAGYRKVVRRMESLSNQLYGQTKFEKIRRQGIANLYYLVVAQGVLEPHEVPAGWGLLELVEDAPPAGVVEALVAPGPGELRCVAQPTWQESTEPQRLGMLQRITQAAMRPTNREVGYVHPAAIQRAALMEPPAGCGE